jgi:hypothetical protein
MKRMLMIKNQTHVVFFPLEHRQLALAFRRQHPEYKGRRIRDIIQAYPSRVQYGVTYLLTVHSDLVSN